MGQQLHRCRDRARTRGYPDISRVSLWCRHRLNGDHCRRDAGGRFDIRDPGGKVWTLRRDNKVNSVSVDGRIDSNSITALIGAAIGGSGSSWRADGSWKSTLIVVSPKLFWLTAKWIPLRMKRGFPQFTRRTIFFRPNSEPSLILSQANCTNRRSRTKAESPQRKTDGKVVRRASLIKFRMVLAFDPNNIPAIVNAIEQVLGAGHPIARTVQAAATDPDLIREAWNAIEALPVEQRRAIAGILAGTIMPGL